MHATNQEKILNSYLKLSSNPSLREISKETGIQMTRVFRLMNGSAMKLSEFEIFSNLVNEKMGSKSKLPELIDFCLHKFSDEALNEIELNLQRRISLWNLKYENKNQIADFMMA